MMRFAPIVPISYLKRLASFSDYQLCLAHIARDNDEYRSFYKDCVRKGKTVILDNGACELGSSIYIETLYKVFEDLECPEVFVIPDSIEGNWELFEKSLNYILKDPPKSKLMAVPHTQDDLFKMIDIPEIDYIGLNKGWLNRLGALAYCIINKPNAKTKRFHLLGVRKNPYLETRISTELLPYIEGIDTSIIYRLGKELRPYEQARPFPVEISFLDNNIDEYVIGFIEDQLLRFHERITGYESNAVNSKVQV